MSSLSTTTEKRDESILSQKYKEQLRLIEDKTGVNGRYMIIFLLCCLALVFVGILESFITNLVGTALPAFLSLKAIESLEMDNEKQWITYWVIFSFYSILDQRSFILKYIPFYYFIKIVFLMWLFLPNFQGASFLYDAFIFNWFKKLEALIEKFHIHNRKSATEVTADLSNNEIKINKSENNNMPATPTKTTNIDSVSSEKKVSNLVIKNDKND